MEILALRHQLAVYQRQEHRPRLRSADCVFWSWLSRFWSGWRDAAVIVQPQTVVAWQRRLRDHWRRLSRPGRPTVSPEIRHLIKNPAPLSGGELIRFPRALSSLALREVAVQAIETAVQKEPYNPVYLKDAGQLCRKVGLFAKAERYYEEALKWDQGNSEVEAALSELRSAKSARK